MKYIVAAVISIFLSIAGVAGFTGGDPVVRDSIDSEYEYNLYPEPVPVEFIEFSEGLYIGAGSDASIGCP